MQTIIEVHCNKSTSMRKRIADDAQLADYSLEVVAQAKKGRPNGWTKLRSSEGEHGAINIQWIESSRKLTCRVINKAGGSPGRISGDLLAYLLNRHKSRITSIHITRKK